MSNGKVVLLIAAVFGLVTAGVHYGGKNFFREMVGGGPFPERSAPRSGSGSAWSEPHGQNLMDEEQEQRVEEWRRNSAVKPSQSADDPSTTDEVNPDEIVREALADL
jgi:hypothetical protein